MNFTRQQLIYGTVIFVIGLFIGWLIFSGPAGFDEHADHDQLSPEEMAQHLQDAHTDEEGHTVYTCSMHPNVRQDEPGNCPICGMDLIPVRGNGDVQEDDYSMIMSEAAVRLADVQTTPVTRSFPQRVLELPGRIRVDERRISYITTHFEGRIRNVNIDFVGAPIREGEVMATIYSPELVIAQRELLESARQKERNPRMYEAAKRKFHLWEFTDEQIQQIEERGVIQTNMEIHSPVNGFVMKRNVVDEQHVMEGSVIYEVANLEHLWVVLEAYEEDLPWIRTGDAITFRTRDGQRYEASVNYIDPVVDPKKRTVGIRADLANPGHHLKPDMLVRGTLHAEQETEKLLVPISSVLWTGPRSLVYVQDASVDAPRFEAREVELGRRAGDHYVIEEGLEEGERVVFHGAFRIDSEMQLADRFSMMNREPGSGAVPAHNHGSMDRGESDRAQFELPDPFIETDHSRHDQPRLADGTSEAFRGEFRDMLESYLNGQKALFASDFDGVRHAFEQFSVELESIGMHRMDGEAHMRWMEHFEAIEGHLDQILNAGHLDGQREGFALLSDLLIDAIHTYAVPGVVYHHFCPMADANWLSGEEEIRNPYMPESMPGCGELIERID